MKRSLMLLIGLMAIGFFLFISCGNDDEGANSDGEMNDVVNGNYIIEIPSCVAASSDGRSAPRLMADTSSTDTNILGIYNGVRMNVGIANELAQFVKAFLNSVSSNLGNVNSLETTTPSGEKISFHREDESNYTLDIWTSNNVKELQADITKVADGDVQGAIYFNSAATPDGRAGFVVVEFDSKDENGNKTMSIKITGVNNPLDPNCPRNIQIDISVDSNGIMNLYGGTYHPYFDIGFQTNARCYIYNAVIDTNNNIATVNLALPTPDISDTNNLFANYGLAQVISNLGMDFIRVFLVTNIGEGTPTNESGQPIDKWLARVVYVCSESNWSVSTLTNNLSSGLYSYMTNLSDDLLTNLSDSQIVEFLTLNENDPDAGWARDFLWIIQIAQPVYFNSGGYVSDGTNVPSGWEAISDTSGLGVVSPAGLASLTVSFSRTNGPGF